MQNTVIYLYSHMNTQHCKASALDTPVTADRGFLCVPGEEEKAREDRRQREAISAQKAL